MRRLRCRSLPSISNLSRHSSSSSSSSSSFFVNTPTAMPARLPSPYDPISSLETQLSTCKTLQQLNPILARLVVTGFVRRSLVLCKLVEFLALSRNSAFLLYARLFVEIHFDSVPSYSSTFLWNNLIRGHSQSQFPEEAVVIFAKMHRKSLKPDNFTFPFVVKAASAAQKLIKEGEQLHGLIVENGFDSDVFVVNNLLHMYSTFGNMESARRLFDVSSSLDVVSWNTVIDCYVKSGAVEMARQLFDEMPVRNEVSWSAMISGYTQTGDLDIARSMFDSMPIRRNTVTWNSMISGFTRFGFLSLARKMFDEMPSRNIISWNAMIAGYVQSGNLESARQLFDQMPERDVVSWSSMISGYAQSNCCREALELFKQMQVENRTRPNEVTLVSVLSACAHLAALDQGKWIHAYIDRNSMRLNDNLGAALIDMYAKCGSIETALEVFRNLDQINISSWNALIMGLAVHGFSHKALEVFAEMKNSDKKPNDITFVGVLTACTHGGLVEEGWQHFESMSKIFGISPELKHYGCMVDLLGRAGLLEEAEEIVRSMPMKPDVMILGALLGACRIHGDVQAADRFRSQFLELKSSQAGCHVLLSNIYAAAGRWSDASEMRSMLKRNGIKKDSGSCSIKLDEFPW